MRVVPLDRPGKGHHSWTFEKTSKFWATSCKNEFNLPLVQITVCIETCLLIDWRTFIWGKNSPECCSILVWIAGCWNSFFKSCNPKNNWCLSRIFGARFGGKDRGLSTCKPWSKQEWGWIHFCMKRLRILNSYQIFKIKNKKSKTYSSWSPFQGLSNGTTLMQIQFGRTVPSKLLFIYFFKLRLL